MLRWGILPRWAKDRKASLRPINARAETVATAPMFRDAFARRRCLVPADAFYEWQPGRGDKQPYAAGRQDGQPMALAALWEAWRGPDSEVLETFTIIVTAANATLAPIQDLMPVVVEPEDWPALLGEAAGDPAVLLRPAPEAVVRVWPVGRAVNSAANSGAALLEPAAG